MQRVPEPELMDNDEQARAYAQADFAQPHELFVERFKTLFADQDVSGRVLDLGCGPADITIRFARAYPACRLDGVDGAPPMLYYGDRAVAAAGLGRRIRLIHAYLPSAALPHGAYDAVISNSLLHHLHDPASLWQAVKHYARPRAPVFIMDLRRPRDPAQAKALVRQYAAGEPQVLRRDFFNSLRAAYTVAEVREQLRQANLNHLVAEALTDRHLTVSGYA